MIAYLLAYPDKFSIQIVSNFVVTQPLKLFFALQKIFAFATLVLSFFFLLITFSRQAGKNCLLTNYLPLPAARVIMNAFFSLTTMANVVVNVLLVVYPDAGDLYVFMISVVFKTLIGYP